MRALFDKHGRGGSGSGGSGSGGSGGGGADCDAAFTVGDNESSIDDRVVANSSGDFVLMS